MSAIAYHFNNQEDIQQDPVNPNIYKLFNEIGSTDKHYRLVANSLELVNEPFIEEYVSNTTGPTHGFGLEVVESYSINRPEDRIEFFDHIGDRRLLWHGTKRENVYKILRDGFNLKLAKKTGMFGSGIYTSDCVTKAVNYADRGYKQCNTCSYSYLFLCEVALGKIRVCKTASQTEREKLGSANSVWGQGNYQSSTAKYWSDSKNTLMICPGPLKPTVRNYLEYNEYIVYYTQQIRLRYLVKVRHTPMRYTSPKTAPGVFPMYQKSLFPDLQISVKAYKPQHAVEASGDGMYNRVFGNYNSTNPYLAQPSFVTQMFQVNTIQATWQPPLPPANAISTRYYPQIQNPTNGTFGSNTSLQPNPFHSLLTAFGTNVQTQQSMNPAQYMQRPPQPLQGTNFVPQRPRLGQTQNSGQLPMSAMQMRPSTNQTTNPSANLTSLMPPPSVLPKKLVNQGPRPKTSNASQSTQQTQNQSIAVSRVAQATIQPQSTQNSLKYVFRSTQNPSQPYTLTPANASTHTPHSFNNLATPKSSNPAKSLQPTSANSLKPAGSAQNSSLLADELMDIDDLFEPGNTITQQSTKNSTSNDLDDILMLDDIYSFLVDSADDAPPTKKKAVSKSSKKGATRVPPKKSIFKSRLHKIGSNAAIKSVLRKVVGSRHNPIQIDG